MTRLRISCLAALVIGLVAPLKPSLSAELTAGAEIVLGRNFSIHSDILGEDRNLLVYLPESYGAPASAERRYPVLYLLDGPAYFQATTGIVRHLGEEGAAVERIPELIVVAIRNIRTPQKATRTRDMTPSHMTAGPYAENSGGAAAFRTFIADELIPQIDSHFRTQKSRILVGHSLAGLFTLDTLIERPELFDAYLVIDPTASWDDEILARKVKGRKPVNSAPAVRLFIAEANTPSETAAERKSHRDSIRTLREAFARSAPAVHLDYQYFKNETHLAVPLIAIYSGLQSIYGDYKKP